MSVTNQDVRNAVGVLATFGLITALDADNGFSISMDALTVNGFDMGAWSVEVRRTRKPAEGVRRG